MKTHTTDDINAYSAIKVDNNMQGVINALVRNGYAVKTPTRAGVISQLLNIYFYNKQIYVNILESVPFNQNANNYTTSQEFAQKLHTALYGN